MGWLKIFFNFDAKEYVIEVNLALRKVLEIDHGTQKLKDLTKAGISVGL